ncbi:MAG: hypothetical protein HY775_11040 [Acidobacteria bacterium]|nr:hypothetical protein [Acidobacteriota bacterium]
MRNRLRIVVALAAVALALGACGRGADTGGVIEAPTGTASATQTPAAP